MNSTVHRVQFGKVVMPGPSTCCGETGYVMGFGKKPAGARGFLSLVGGQEDPVFKQLKQGLETLEANRIRSGGPYSDKDGAVAAFASEVASGLQKGDLYGLIERIIDTRPVVMGDLPTGQRVADHAFDAQFPRQFDSGYSFRLDREWNVPDTLVTAGELLTQPRRRVTERGSGAELIIESHSTDAYTLAVSVLRHFGYNAYPAQAVVPVDHTNSTFHPLVAVINPQMEYPLTTFDLLRFHPPMGSIDILSDVAMLGATWAALAEARVRHLTVEMLTQSKEGRELDMSELTNQLRRIADALFEAHKRWPGCHYISDALLYAFEDFSNTLFAINHATLTAQLDELSRLGRRPNFDPRAAFEQFAAEAKETAGRFTDHIRSVLARHIERQGTTQ